MPNVIGYLSDKACSFTIADFVKHVDCIYRIFDFHLNWMCRISNIFIDGLSQIVQKALLRVRNGRKFGGKRLKTNTSTVVSKTLLEPEVVPPLHGDEVSKPHVR